MRIILNGNPTELTGAHPTVKDAVEKTISKTLTSAGTTQDGSQLGIAVALGENILPRSRWAETELAEGDQLEIITAVQGG